MTQQPQDPQDPHKLDAALTEALRSAFDSIPIPENKDVWSSMQKRLAADRRRRAWLRLAKMSGTAAASMILAICLAAGTFNPVFAFTSLYSMVVHKSKDGAAISITFRSNEGREKGALTAPPPDEDQFGSVQTGSPPGSQPPPLTPPPSDPSGGREGETIEVEKVKTTVEQARKELEFPLLVPTEVPEGFVLESVELNRLPGKKADSAMMTYKNRDSNPEGFIAIRATKLAGERASTFGSFSGEKPAVKEINILGDKAVMVVTKRTVHLEWSTGAAYYDITTSIGEEASVKLVNSMKNK
ncbi:DUF4367 domain-containing protein [Paenibacillus sp. MBLB4367]|uniref:DUF4367 domain-containing protein n=1 Tax=Paenibacillus sp. MBLB4367 TaxID=3384767 RepID=UPI0039081B56